MTGKHVAPEIQGKTIRLTWTEGPTKGTTHEHLFHEDGTVEWRALEGSRKGELPKERAEYAAIQVADDIYAVSYLAPSGYTLTRGSQLSRRQDGRLRLEGERVGNREVVE